MQSEGLSGDHSAENAEDVLVGNFLNSLGDVPLGIELAGIFDGKLLPIFLGLLVDAPAPLLAPLADFAEVLTALVSGLLLVVEFKCVVPLVFVEVEQHLLFQFVGLVVYVD